MLNTRDITVSRGDVTLCPVCETTAYVEERYRELEKLREQYGPDVRMPPKFRDEFEQYDRLRRNRNECGVDHALLEECEAEKEALTGLDGLLAAADNPPSEPPAGDGPPEGNEGTEEDPPATDTDAEPKGDTPDADVPKTTPPATQAPPATQDDQAQG